MGEQRCQCEYPVPKILSKSRDQVLNVFAGIPASASTAYDNTAWEERFRDDRDFREVSKLPNPMRRGDIQGLSSQVHAGGYQHARRLFLASMIWGFVNDNRGPWRTKEKMLSVGGVEAIITNAAIQISKGSLLEAYRDFRLSWCGPAFFTKYFYFVGLGARIEPLPLILDANVAKGLEKISAGEGWQPSQFVKVDKQGVVKRYPEGYELYVCCLNKWAKELGCRRADEIEYWLFKQGQSKGDGDHRPGCR